MLIQRAVPAFALCALGLGATAGAQSTHTVVRVLVADSLGAPLSAAQISFVYGLREVLHQTVTDSLGRRSFGVDSGEFALVLRKIGYRRADHVIRTTGRDTLIVRIVLRPNVHSLDPVQVTARSDPTRKSYLLDADEIENSEFTLEHAADIIAKLRPDMIHGRVGPPDRLGRHVDARGRRTMRVGRTTRGPNDCNSAVAFVWINGKKILLPPPNPKADYPRELTRAVAREVLDVLVTIRPEHIAELRYADCFDTSVAATGSNNAVFITLREGVAYDRGRGSYVIAPVP